MSGYWVHAPDGLAHIVDLDEWWSSTGAIGSVCGESLTAPDLSAADPVWAVHCPRCEEGKARWLSSASS